MPKGKTFIICGPSGVWKGTVVSRLLEADPTLYFSVSATTRAPRAGEADGVHYHFLTRERFQEWIDAGDFLEHAQFVGNFYGTPRRYVDEAMDQGRDVLLDIEIQGAEQIHQKRPEAVRIYIAPPSWEELERRAAAQAREFYVRAGPPPPPPPPPLFRTKTGPPKGRSPPQLRRHYSLTHLKLLPSLPDNCW